MLLFLWSDYRSMAKNIYLHITNNDNTYNTPQTLWHRVYYDHIFYNQINLEYILSLKMQTSCRF